MLVNAASAPAAAIGDGGGDGGGAAVSCDVGDAACEGGMGFWWAIAYTSTVCFLVKLAAIVVQQKVIGELCGARSVGIRSQVGPSKFRGTPDCNESAALHSYPDAHCR